MNCLVCCIKHNCNADQTCKEYEQEPNNFFEIKTFFTGNINAEQANNIINNSEEALKFTGKTAAVGKSTAKVLYQYVAKEPNEITISEGDIIEVYNKDEGWWNGLNKTTGKTGLFPGNYVAVIDTITNLSNSTNRHYGRPMWENELNDIRKQVKAQFGASTKVGVFLCGPVALSKELKKHVHEANRKSSEVPFVFHKENF